MKRIFVLLTIMIVALISGCNQASQQAAEPAVEWDKFKCSTVDPKLIEKCCAEQNQGNMMIQCVGNWVIKNDACSYECSTEGELAVAEEKNVGIANPASTFCENKGYKIEIRDMPEGQVGYCIFPDGTECEEWSFQRGTCGEKFQ